ncbi:MAG: DDE-type integrase/transposase/recombinase [Candidatus Moranbacteria bacterium]|nr:DDE-type integrase/transposase/recombinase [Candidatus Moranbacteria bacterium]
MDKEFQMSKQTKRELLQQIKPNYLKLTSKKEKGILLDEYCKHTKMDRKYVISLLSPKKDLAIRKLVGRKPKAWTYTAEDIYWVKKIWKVMDYACGQRLAPYIGPMIKKLRQFGELDIPDSIAKKIKHISKSTIDRRLKKYRQELKRRLITTTKPGTLLKSQIPIKTKSWDEKRTGYCELDSVAHCGSSAKGQFVNSINLTDLVTQWTEGEAILGKAQKRVIKALNNAGNRLPSGLKGIDPDNGGEFINWGVFEYTKQKKIEFTRGRPYKKNDNAHIEQKNWTHVRQIFGYQRYETEKQVRLMNDIYRNELRLYKNFFIPNVKLISKKRVGKNGEKIKRKYDRPRTPYERVMRSKQISKEKKAELKKIYDKLNPAELRRNLKIKLDRLKKIK